MDVVSYFCRKQSGVSKFFLAFAQQHLPILLGGINGRAMGAQLSMKQVFLIVDPQFP